MNIFPAIDLKGKKCVRLKQGDDNTSVVLNEDPIEQAKYFEDQGCARLHLIDLDSAFGRNGINNIIIEKIRRSINIPIQIGGGIRTVKTAENYFNLGADYLIIGSFAISNIDDVKDLADSYPDKIYVALDILKNKIMIRGWKEESDFTPSKLFEIYEKTNVRGYVLTDIEKDGMLTGLNQEMIIRNLALTNKKLIVGGGLKDNFDLVKINLIKSKNLEGVIAGKSFYVGNIDLKEAQLILNNNA